MSWCQSLLSSKSTLRHSGGRLAVARNVLAEPPAAALPPPDRIEVASFFECPYLGRLWL